MNAADQQAVITGEAQARIRAAQQKIQQAQDALNDATSILSSLCYGNAQCVAVGKLAEKAKAHWYRVDRLRADTRVTLDSMSREHFLAALAKREPTTTTEVQS